MTVKWMKARCDLYKIVTAPMLNKNCLMACHNVIWDDRDDEERTYESMMKLRGLARKTSRIVCSCFSVREETAHTQTNKHVL